MDPVETLTSELKKLGDNYLLYSDGEPLDPIGPCPTKPELASIYRLYRIKDAQRRRLARSG